jgi:hypothetical protein
MLRFLVRIAVFLPLVFSFSQAQTTTQMSPQAVMLASQALQASVGSTALTDVTLQGTVNSFLGSDEDSGNFTLEVKGNQESKLSLNLSSGQRTEIRQGQAGEWVDAEGVQHPMAFHNCWVDASWLFPTFSVRSALNDPQVVSVYLGQTVRDGVTVDHLQLSRTIPGQSTDMATQIQGLSALDLYLDATSHLPVAIDFNLHPDNDLIRNIPAEIQFSGYQKVNGINVPFHIQKFLQGTLTLDFYVSNVTINPGIPDSEFSIQAVQGGN